MAELVKQRPRLPELAPINPPLVLGYVVAVEAGAVSGAVVAGLEIIAPMTPAFGILVPT
jgi:hypothetical protein